MALDFLSHGSRSALLIAFKCICKCVYTILCNENSVFNRRYTLLHTLWNYFINIPPLTSSVVPVT